MTIAATIVFYGEDPSTIVLQSNSQMDGTTMTGVPTLAPGVYVFPIQAAGGLYNFHGRVGCQQSINVLSVNYLGGGTLTVKKRYSSLPGTPVSTVGTVSAQGDLSFNAGDLTLPPNVDLFFTTSGATNPIVTVTAQLALHATGLETTRGQVQVPLAFATFGTVAVPIAITAAGGIAAVAGVNQEWIVKGSGGAINPITATPQITAGTRIGQELILVGGHATNTLTLTNGNGLNLSGSITLDNTHSIGLFWDGVNWSELYRS